MKPLIKWPGGKYKEYLKFKQVIPTYNRYFEPFFGGGGVFFRLEPDQAFVNDLDPQLIQFYRDVKSNNSTFHTQLQQILYDWRVIEQIANDLLQDFLALYPNDLRSINDLEGRKSAMQEIVNAYNFDILSSLKFGDADELQPYIIRFLLLKADRILKLQQKHNKIFPDDNLSDHLVTAIKSGYYTFIRDEWFNTEHNTSATFYFIREFAYGSMFRFNSEGKFNIPYGGINYNNKDFERKVDILSSSSVRRLFNQITIHNKDFEEFIAQFEFNSDDFIFLDPPYDSDFSSYSDNVFDETDQQRLADSLANLSAKWLLVIKATDLIWELYKNMQQQNQNINILTYDKKYTYNVRGRNERDVSHLLITNYEPNSETTDLSDYF